MRAFFVFAVVLSMVLTFAGFAEEKGPINIPVIIGRGGPRLVKGLLAMKQALEYLKLPYAIFGPDTPVTMVAEYAARLVNASHGIKEVHR